MKKLIFVVAAMFAMNAQAQYQAVGGIEFKSQNTWVSPIYNDTLCFDGSQFHAVLKNYCIEWDHHGSSDADPCVRTANVAVSQPAVAMTEKCVSVGSGSDLKCEEVASYQSPNLEIAYLNDRGQTVGTQNMTVPSCQDK